MKKVHYFIILVIIDLAILVYLYFSPDIYGDGMTTLFYSFILAGISFLPCIIGSVFKQWGWCLVFLINTVFLFYAIIYGAGFLQRMDMKEYYIDYRFEANDSTFTLTMTKSTQEFDILYHGKGYDLGYCRGTYTTKGNNEYILEVDSNRSPLTSDRRFFIKNDSIINFKGNDTKIKLKKTFF